MSDNPYGNDLDAAFQHLEDLYDIGTTGDGTEDTDTDTEADLESEAYRPNFEYDLMMQDRAEEEALMAQERRLDLIHDIHTSTVAELWVDWNIHWNLIREEPFGYYDSADYGGLTVGEYAELLFAEMCKRGL